jgi:hypothetical protein
LANLRTPLLLAFLALAPLACRTPLLADPCDSLGPVLTASSFVLVVEPQPGVQVKSPLEVRGCSRTFESNVVWRLHARDGSVLAAGHASGGGIDGAASFAFDVGFDVGSPQSGHLEVFEEDVSDGEGFAPPRSIVPVVLMPGSR